MNLTMTRLQTADSAFYRTNPFFAGCASTLQQVFEAAWGHLDHLAGAYRNLAGDAPGAAVASTRPRPDHDAIGTATTRTRPS